MIYYNLLIFFAVFVKALAASNNLQCSINDTTRCYQDNDMMLLFNFQALSELKFNCSESVSISILSIYPSKFLILNNDLEISDLIILVPNSFFIISLYNFKGFDLKSNPFNRINFENFSPNNIIWFVISSDFAFYHNFVLLETICNEKFFDKNKEWRSVFNKGKLYFLICITLHNN